MSQRIHIGTSGWQYKHWKKSFYPEEIAASEMLSYYAGQFSTVEINNTFYQLPTEKTLNKWKDTVPEDFLFTVKASRYITHMKKMKDPQKPVSAFLDRVSLLGKRLGPILFQLPPNWKCNPERLIGFLRQLPEKYRYVFEFRDPSWFIREIYEMLQDKGASFCIYELAGSLSPKEVTADFIYIRLHGPEQAYEGSYDTETLAGWAGAISSWQAGGHEIFCYFDNDQQGYAARNGLELQNMLRGKNETE
jgi:uncharacterized protein YecE (DUF72 family)